jgi:hypothetical protein
MVDYQFGKKVLFHIITLNENTWCVYGVLPYPSMKPYRKKVWLRMILPSRLVSLHGSLNSLLTLRKRVCFRIGRLIAFDHENALEQVRSALCWSGLSPLVSKAEVFTTSNGYSPLMFNEDLLLDLRDMDVSSVMENAEGKQKPHNDANDNDDVENFFDLSVHWNVAIDQPEQDADDDQGDDERN